MYLQSFDLAVERFGLDLDALRHSAIVRTFRAWFEGQEKECIKRNNSVTEVRFLTKLVFVDQDTDVTFTVVVQMCVFRCLVAPRP